MKKKFLLILLAIVSALCLVFGLTACGKAKDAPNQGGTEQTTPGDSQGGSHTHQFSSLWSSNDVTHWHAATCGHSEKKDEATHNYVNGVCTTCYHAHQNHSYGTYTSNENGHTRTCTVCQKTETGSHNYVNGVCTTCNHAHENHSYGIYTSNEGGHSRTCSICQKAETGSHTYANGVCTTCNYTHVNHSFGSYTADDSEHTHTCTVCHKAETGSHNYQNGVCVTCNHAHENHVYGEWVETQEASCTQTGQHYHDCFCGHRESETIPTKDHQYTDCVCDFCGAMDPDAVTVDLYIDNQLQNTLYTDAEMGYKILLPEVSNQYSAYFDGWYANTEYMEPLTGDETYHTNSAIYARWIPVLNYEIKVDKGEATIVKCYNTSATAVVVPAIHQKIYPITGIAADAFKGMTTIRWLIILSPMRTIGAGAFNGCNSMKKVVLPDSLTSIGNQAFYDCSSIEKLVIPDSVTSIGKSAFFNCSGLTSITIPDSVTTIGWYAFQNCSGLESVTIGSGVTSIGGEAFDGTAYYIDPSNWDESGVLYIGKYLIEAKETISGSYTIRANTKVIASSAFSDCYYLTGITIPDGVTSIGDYAFSFCIRLTSITIPDSVTSIGGFAFSRCDMLLRVTIGIGVTSIGERAFWAYNDRKPSIYFKGTPSMWYEIEISSDNTHLTSAARYYFSAEKPTAEQWQESINWWHYAEDGTTIVLWTKDE